jgi:hypothetical protein
MNSEVEALRTNATVTDRAVATPICNDFFDLLHFNFRGNQLTPQLKVPEKLIGTQQIKYSPPFYKTFTIFAGARHRSVYRRD